MKRMSLIAVSVAGWLLMAGTALAQDGSELGPPEGPQVGGIGGSVGGVGGAGEGSAFTGAEVAGLIVLACVLVVVGATVLLLGRRRAVDAGA
jgi:hypothetical protein